MSKALNVRAIKLLFIFFFLLAPSIISQADSVTQNYRDDAKGNKYARKKAIMDGNLVRTIFRNDGQIGTWPERPSGEWPNNGNGHSYLDGGTPIVSSRVESSAGVIHPAETSYREEVDLDPATGELWVMNPVPGYNNPGSPKPAMSNDPTSWPLVWPTALNLTDDWNGHWYGYFGKDVFNANLETFFVMDDSQDKEWTRSPYNVYPVLSDTDRGGLGLRVEVRGFQWSNQFVEDIIFWHYDIINISDFNRDSTIFGFYCDSDVGDIEDNADDNANYNTQLDLAYAYDYDGIAPQDNWKTGYVGYAFMESPGNALNGIDDDEDGLIDERRDDGIDNDGDWKPFTDLNGNGKWDAIENEPLNDDLGADGVGPSNLNYAGPDAGEGDGIPTPGEPNFDQTDKDESDQIGLTSLAIEWIGNKGPSSIWPKNDEVIWNKMLPGTFDTTIQNSNIQILFGSGSFPLMLNKRERFSVALLFGENLDDLILNKKMAQLFYNNNYRLPDSLTSVEENNLILNPNDFYLGQNYPNPFNPSTKISWQSPVASYQKLKVYDILGNEVATLVDEFREAGKYEMNFDASNLSSGVYIYKLQAGDPSSGSGQVFISSKKMLLLK